MITGARVKQHTNNMWVMATVFASVCLVFMLCTLCFDESVFPIGYTITVDTKTATNHEKGISLIDSITHQMQYELSSTYGWSANDILFNSYILDNRAYRQFGVYNATKTLVDSYSLVIARLGSNDREDENLFKARQNYFSMSPKEWGYFPMASAERYYNRGLKEIEVYKKNLSAGKAMYNCKTDNIHTLFQIVTGDRLLGYALGLLEDANNLPFYTLDNRVYEVQGMAIVIRDFIRTLYTLHPMVEKNNEENFKKAMLELDLICNYNPIWIASTPFNNGALIRSYVLNVKNRLEDIQNSIRM